MTISYYACVLHFILHECAKLYMRVHVWFDAIHVFCICTCRSHTCTIYGMGDLYHTYFSSSQNLKLFYNIHPSFFTL